MTTQKKIEANRKNALKGGRPKGKKSPQTLEKEQTLQAIRSIIYGKANSLIHSQYAEAVGTSMLMRIDEYKNKKGFVIDRKHRVVTDPDEIIAVLDEWKGDNDSGRISDGKYYYITTQKPNHKAAVALLDRAYGKAVQPITVPEEEDDGAMRDLAMEAIGKFINPKSNGTKINSRGNTKRG
jgi:hypothetical protein